MGLKWVAIFVLLDIHFQCVLAGFTVEVYYADNNMIIFKWSRFPGATSYEIDVRPIDTPGAKPGFAVYSGNVVLGSINNLTPNTNYTFTVKAKNSTGAVLAKRSGDQMTAPEQADPIIAVTAVNSNTLEMEFVTQPDVDSYAIRAVDTKHTFMTFVMVTSSPGLVPSLQPYTSYNMVIMAVNAGGRSQPGDSVTVRTLLPPPQINSSSPNNNSIDVRWSDIPGAVLYTVNLFRKNLNYNESITKNTTYLNISFSGLDMGAEYHIHCYAWDIEGRKGETANSTQSTRPPTPESVNVTMATNTTSLGLSVSWEMLLALDGPFWYSVSSNILGLQCNSTSMSCELSPVSCGTVYTLEVTAHNDAGPSIPSAPFSFTTVPCPPSSLTVAETTPGHCTFSWGTVSHADRYKAKVTNGLGSDTVCNTNGTSCNFSCECGYTFFMSVFAVNGAGFSPPGSMINYTTVPCCPSSVNVSLISPQTLEVEWERARGAEIYETRAADSSHTILCNDSAPICVLSYLECDTPYNIKVIPCNDISGCNHNCIPHTQDTAPCAPTDLTLTKVNSSAVTASWTNNNRIATYAVFVNNNPRCNTGSTSCDITDLPCGSNFIVTVTANSAIGDSLPSYSEQYETEPCCPASLMVKQVTQAMTNVSWSAAKGAHTFLTTLTSSKGHARCHTEDTHCIMGCITCGTNYSVSMEAYSLSGLQTTCTYDGFSSSLCCPTNVRIYWPSPTILRVSWRSSSGPPHRTLVTMEGTGNNYNCTALPGVKYCDIANVRCGDEYTVVVAPVSADGSTEDFCPQRQYEVMCIDGGLSSIIYRGKRSLD